VAQLWIPFFWNIILFHGVVRTKNFEGTYGLHLQTVHMTYCMFIQNVGVSKCFFGTIKLLLQTDAQNKCFKRILKFTIKQLQHVLVLSPSSGSIQFELAKVTFVKSVCVCVCVCGGGGRRDCEKKFLWNIMNLHHPITQCSVKMESKATATLWKS
jgi:hypothetical protein